MILQPHQVTIVLASGVFDILHLGHLFYLEQSKKLGQKLYVVLARDKTVYQKKGKPFNNEHIRKKILQALRCVDAVILGDEDFTRHQFDIIKKIKPSYITIGYDQPYDEAKLAQAILQKTGHKVAVKRIPLYKGLYNKTSSNIKKIYHYHQKRK